MCNYLVVPIDSQGIDVDALERSIEELGDVRSQWKATPTRPYWAMVYLVPNFQNPTGFCISPGNGSMHIGTSSIFKSRVHDNMHTYTLAPLHACLFLDRARRLVEVASKYDLLVICDDVYDLRTVTVLP